MSSIAIKTADAPQAIGPYSQAIKAGNMLFLSGQIALDPISGMLENESIAHETHRIMKNIKAVLQAAGFELKQVVKTSIFMSSMDHFSAVNEVYAGYFDSHFPARETVAVAGLPRGANVEISMIAVQ